MLINHLGQAFSREPQDCQTLQKSALQALMQLPDHHFNFNTSENLLNQYVEIM